MVEKRKGFDFEEFESMKSGQAEAARLFLLSAYPGGSNAKDLARYVEDGGAKCTFFKEARPEGEYLYFCKYIRPNHGLMALVSSIEWTIIVVSDKEGLIAKSIYVGREAAGP